MGSEPTAAGGGRKEASEWQRSIKSRISVSPKILSGTATGTPERLSAKEGNYFSPQMARTVPSDFIITSYAPPKMLGFMW